MATVFPRTAPALGLPPDAVGGPERLPALTGLRIFAALAVYFTHLAKPAGAPAAIFSFLAAGYMGVTLFFVLSGFVLTINYFDALRRPRAGRLLQFAVARFARVYPIYALVLAYVVVRTHALGEPVPGVWWEHVLAVQAWDPDLRDVFALNAPAWSVGVEIFLYACFPVLVVVVARLRNVKALLLAAAGVAVVMLAVAAWFALTGRDDLAWDDPGSAHRWLYRLPAARLGDFLLGILAARLYLELRGRDGLGRAAAWLAAGGAVAIVGLMAWPAHLRTSWSMDVAYAIPSAMLVLGLAMAPRGRLGRALSLPFVVLLGEASYAFYLIHHQAIRLLGGGRWTIEVSATTIAYEALTLGLVLCLAVGLHLLVERPARVVIRRAGERAGHLRRPPATAPVPDVR